MYFLKLYLLLFMNCYVFADISVNTTVGEIIGKNGEHFSMFLGIPYGRVDEANPFGPATPHPAFKTPFKAFNDMPICTQFYEGVPVGTIHCLQLNIYTPNNMTQDQKLPVMVFIHGGQFLEGNSRLSTYSPTFLVKHDVILVTLHYRLGPYGALCILNTEYTNQGLKDQKLALQWVKNNIKSFGGDDENVTLFGHSAGSASTDYHLLFNEEKLFDKVILQSGNAIVPTVNEDDNIEFLQTIAKEIGEDETNIRYLMKKISHIYSHDVLNKTRNVAFKICIDNDIVKKAPTVDISNIKIMIGGTSKEALFFYTNAKNTFYENYEFKKALNQGFSKMADEGVNVMKNFYTGKDGVVDFTSNYVFNYPMERSLKYYVGRNAVVYRYLFTYDGGRNYMKAREGITVEGSTHADELGYLFDMKMFHNMSDADKLVVDRMTLMWTNFAKYGDPTSSTSPILPLKWLPFTDYNVYLQIDKHLQLIEGSPFKQQMSFWELFYDRYGMYATGIDLGELWPQCFSYGVKTTMSALLIFMSFLFSYKIR